MDITGQLQLMKTQAARLASDASPTTAYILQALPSLIEDDLFQLVAGYSLPPSRILRLGEESGLDPALLGTVLDRLIARDFEDYTLRYRNMLSLFSQSSKSIEEIESFICRMEPDSHVFLLHDYIRVWDPSSELVGIFEIYCAELELDETFNIQDRMPDTDPFESVIGGYLILTKKAYPTTLQLLEASFREGWARWADLWKWY